MRNWIAIAALMSTCLVGAPAGAQTFGFGSPLMTVGEAQDVAAMNGVVAVRKIEFYDGAWHVVGRDRSGRRIEMEIDPHSGAIAHLERFD